MTDDHRDVPLGTSGRAGRGSQSGTTPSSAARSLAGGASRPPRRPGEPAGSTGTGRPRLHAVPDDATAEPPPTSHHSGPQEPPPTGLPLDEVLTAVVAAAQRVLGDDWEARLARMLATLRRRLSGDYEVDDFGHDPEVAELLVQVLEPLAEKWFRLEVRGVHNIPAEGGALLVGNHSGTVPIDGLITSYAVHRYAQRTLRPLAADLVFALPFVGETARKFGATLACTEDAERLLGRGELAAVWPEGFKGVGKPFSERYKLQRFGRGGFVSSAMRAQVPIVPVSIVGAEEIYPLVGNLPSLARLLGLPYLPITPFFPWLGLLGLVPLPSKWIIEFGEPVRTDAYAPEAADDPMLLFNVTDQVRETIQQTLYGLLVDRGGAFF